MATPVPSDRLIGYRMNADKDFADRVRESSFTSSEWELLMSVVSFEIDGPEDPDSAELRPELEGLDQAIDAMSELPDANPYEQAPSSTSSAFGELFAGLKGLLDRGGDRTDQRQEATSLITEYTAFLEGLIREREAWADLCDEVATAD